MKKVFILLFLFFILTAQKCHKQEEIINSSHVFEQSYSSKEFDKSITDLYEITKFYSLDSIPFDKWIVLKGDISNGYMQQHIATRYTDTADYIFVHTAYYRADTAYFSIKVRKIKDIKYE